MSLPSNFGLLALSPTIRTNDAFLFLQTGVNGYVDMFIQSATGSPVNIMTITSGVPIANTVYINSNGNDANGIRGSITLPFESIEAGLSAATIGDTVEVFPGTYNVTGNLFKDGVDYYFHKGSYVTLSNQGRIHIPAITSQGLKIKGNFNLASLNGNGPQNIFEIQGSQNLIEFDSIECNTGNLVVSGEFASVLFKGNKIYNALPPTVYGEKLKIIKTSEVRFEDSFVGFQSIETAIDHAQEGAVFKNCTIGVEYPITENTKFCFTGKVSMTDCLLPAPVKFQSTGRAMNELNNCKILAGILISGSGYFNDCIFEPSNSNKFFLNSLIANMGGYSVFKNCYAKNPNNTSYVNTTYTASGGNAGASNFNIIGNFTSFKPTGVSTTVKFGTFTYDSTFK